jgi:hypothetical protein
MFAAMSRTFFFRHSRDRFHQMSELGVVVPPLWYFSTYLPERISPYSGQESKCLTGFRFLKSSYQPL